MAGPPGRGLRRWSGGDGRGAGRGPLRGRCIARGRRARGWRNGCQRTDPHARRPFRFCRQLAQRWLAARARRAIASGGPALRTAQARAALGLANVSECLSRDAPQMARRRAANHSRLGRENQWRLAIAWRDYRVGNCPRQSASCRPSLRCRGCDGECRSCPAAGQVARDRRPAAGCWRVDFSTEWRCGRSPRVSQRRWARESAARGSRLRRSLHFVPTCLDRYGTRKG
jgi:hypothetical protein